MAANLTAVMPDDQIEDRTWESTARWSAHVKKAQARYTLERVVALISQLRSFAAPTDEFLRGYQQGLAALDSLVQQALKESTE